MTASVGCWPPGYGYRAGSLACAAAVPTRADEAAKTNARARMAAIPRMTADCAAPGYKGRRMVGELPSRAFRPGQSPSGDRLRSAPTKGGHWVPGPGRSPDRGVVVGGAALRPPRGADGPCGTALERAGRNPKVGGRWR